MPESIFNYLVQEGETLVHLKKIKYVYTNEIESSVLREILWKQALTLGMCHTYFTDVQFCLFIYFVTKWKM